MPRKLNHPWRRFFVGGDGKSGAHGEGTDASPRRPAGKGIVIEAGLQHYLKRINSAPLLTAECEQTLGKKIRAALESSDQLDDEQQASLRSRRRPSHLRLWL